MYHIKIVCLMSFLLVGTFNFIVTKATFSNPSEDHVNNLCRCLWIPHVIIGTEGHLQV